MYKQMKTMKIWRVALAMVAVLSLASCSSDEEITDFRHNIGGGWEKVSPKGVEDVGLVVWTFHPNVKPAPDGLNGDLEIFTSHWAAGDTTVYYGYYVFEDGELQMFSRADGDDTKSYKIVKMTANRMVLNTIPPAPEAMEFKRIWPQWK